MSRIYDPADEDQVGERQENVDRARQQGEADWEWLASAPQGRRILVELIAQSGFLMPAFSEQPLVMAFLEGKRTIGAHIHARVTQAVDGQSLPALLAEVMVPPNARRAEHRDARRRRPSG